MVKYIEEVKATYTLKEIKELTNMVWKEAQKDLMLEIINKTDWSNGEILEFINNKLKDYNRE